MRKFEKLRKKNKQKTALSGRLKSKTKKIRTYAYLDWLSWFPSKEGKK
jgi:hypothetical protein